MQIEEPQQDSRQNRRRRVRLLTPAELADTTQTIEVTIDPTVPLNNLTAPMLRSTQHFPQQTFPTLIPQPFQFETTQNTPIWPSFPRTSWPGQFQLNRSSGQQEIFTFGQITEEEEEENRPLDNSGHHGVVISDPQIDPIALNSIFNETEEEETIE